MHITPKLNSCFQFRVGQLKYKDTRYTEKRADRILVFWIVRLKLDGKRVDYLLGLLMTRTIPGLRLAKFPLFSFNASTVVL